MPNFSKRESDSFLNRKRKSSLTGSARIAFSSVLACIFVESMINKNIYRKPSVISSVSCSVFINIMKRICLFLVPQTNFLLLLKLAKLPLIVGLNRLTNRSESEKAKKLTNCSKKVTVQCRINNPWGNYVFTLF